MSLDRFYLCRRTAKAALNQVSIHVGYAPFPDIQIRAGLVQFRVANGRFSILVTGGLRVPLLLAHGVFVLLYQLRITRTAGSGGTIHGDYDRKRAFHSLDTSVDMTFYGDTSGLFIYVQDFLGIRDLGQSQFLGDLRTYLCRIAVDPFGTTDDNILIVDFLDSRGKRIGCG